MIFLYLMCLILLVIKCISSHLPETLKFATLSIFLDERENIYMYNGFKLKDNYFENKHIIKRISAKRRNDKISGVAKA